MANNEPGLLVNGQPGTGYAGDSTAVLSGAAPEDSGDQSNPPTTRAARAQAEVDGGRRNTPTLFPDDFVVRLGRRTNCESR